MAKILVVDDDVEFANTVQKWLQIDHHNVDAVYDPNDALEHLKSFEYDVLLLDWNLPHMTGLELCKKYRTLNGTAAVMMLTALSATDSKIQGLDAGADDYLTKPFEMKEMLARVRALIRRGPMFHAEVLKSGHIELNTGGRTVAISGVEIHLKPQEYLVLEFFLRNPGKVISQETLINRLWSSQSEVTNDAVYTCIKGIRQKLGETEAIKTVHGIGYRFDPPTQ